MITSRLLVSSTRRLGQLQYSSIKKVSPLSDVNGRSETGDRVQSYTVHKKFNHPQEFIYQLISEVDKYHEFIPYCADSFIKERDDKNQPTLAGLRVGYKAFNEVFSCDLQCEKPKLIIAKSVTHSLFRSLYTEWTIEYIDDKRCKAQLKLMYEFKNELYHRVSAMLAKTIASLMTKAFEKRAYEVSRVNQ